MFSVVVALPAELDILDAGGSGLRASTAAAAASARASRPAVVPIQRQPARMRRQRMSMNAPAQKRCAAPGDWLNPRLVGAMPPAAEGRLA